MTAREIELALKLTMTHLKVIGVLAELRACYDELNNFYITQNGDIITDSRCRTLLKYQKNLINDIIGYNDGASDCIGMITALTKDYCERLQNDGVADLTDLC